MSEGKGVRQHVRLFLEGREVPFISASISSVVGQPCVANIDLVPLQKIKFIRPKTQVHIFVRDENIFGDKNLYLAFEGEVSGRGFSKRQDNRAVRITAMDYSTYWEDAKAYFLNAAAAVGKASETVSNGEPPPAQVAKALAGKVVPTDTTAESFLIRTLTSQRDSDGNVDLVLGVTEVLRKLGIVNEFYRAAYERLRVTDRMRAYNFSKLGKFLAGINTDIFLASFAGSNGGIESVQVLLNKILGFVFHEIVCLPFPGKGLDETSAGVAQFLFIPDAYTIPPPKCNVLFPNQIIGFSFDDDFRSQPTRYAFRPSFVLPAQDSTKTMTYPMQFYPTAFSDFMFGKKTVDTSEGQSLLGPSAIIKSADGKTYANIAYGNKKDKAVGTSAHPVLREADFLTNEESIRGIYLAMEAYSPNYTALQRAATSTTRSTFFKDVGAYLFFKKRFAARQCSADIRFNPNIVPGFNALFLDDSDAGQSFIAKVQSVTHILTNAGCATQLGIAYGRDFDEVDALTGQLGDPPVPPWVDADVFGKPDAADFKEETDFLKKQGVLSQEESLFRDRLLKDQPAKDGRPARAAQVPQSYKNLSDFYSTLIGCDAITGFTESITSGTKKTTVALATTRGTVDYLVDRFKKTDGKPKAREVFVRNYTKRLFITIQEAFSFLGASTNSIDEKNVPIIPDEFAMFSADKTVTGALKGRFDGTGFSDENVLKIRREIIDAYVALLKSRRNFRG